MAEKGRCVMKVPTRRWPECDECGYSSVDEDEFVVGSDDGFRCSICDEDRDKEVRDELDRDDG
jgi:tRNA(Ile2) C34 agmatinyltransferase TiaS